MAEETRPEDTKPSPPVHGPQDPVTVGYCSVRPRHLARVWQVPRDGKWYCAVHIRQFVNIALWHKGQR